MPEISLIRVSRVFELNDGLHPTDLVIESGSLTAIVGPSGSGKSTLLRLIAGLDVPDAGEIRFDGELVTESSPATRGLGLVVAHGALYSTMTAEGNIGFPLRVEHVAPDERASRVRAVASRLGVGRILGRRPATLSAGERQLVATGRATVRDNDLVLLDEAMAGIDPHRKADALRTVRELHQRGATVLYATNDQHEAMALATHLVVLERGRVRQVGPPEHVYRNPATVFVAGFLGDPGMNVLPVGRIGADRIRLGETEFALDHVPDRPGLLLGVRPEDVWIASPDTPAERRIRAGVTHVERLGSADLAHVAFGEPDEGSLDFVARLRATGRVSRGDIVDLTLDPDRVRFFDRETGRALPIPDGQTGRPSR